MNEGNYFWCGFFLAIAICICVVVAACGSHRPHTELTIVSHHAAHYEMDPATGASTFHWNDESTEKASKP